jgi:transcription initiation factor IIE alpha subunit
MVGKKKFYCTACKWKFTANFPPNLCPYCGKGSVTVDSSKGAEELLREIEEMEEQFKSRA